MMKTIKQLIGILILVSIVIVTIVFVNRQIDSQDQLMNTFQPTRGTIINKKIVAGDIFPYKGIEIKSPISGTLEEYYVEIDGKVRKGEKLAKVKMLPEPIQLENARNRLNYTRIVYENDRTIYERDSVLFGKKIISELDFQESKKNCLLSHEQYESAQNQFQLLKEGFVSSSNISNIITATSDGTVIDLPLEIGAPIMERGNFNEGSTLAYIAQLDSLIFRGRLIEKDILTVRKGMEISILFPSIKNLQANAVIRKIIPRGELDQGITKYSFEAVLNLPDSIHIYSGFSANAEIILNRKEDVLMIPEKALVFESDSVFVYRLKQNEWLKTPVKTGVSDGLQIEILDGLREEDRLKIMN